MKVTVLDPSSEPSTYVRDMPQGSVGVAKDGRVFFRTLTTATCLTECGQTISNHALENADIKVRILSKGTRIILEVE